MQHRKVAIWMINNGSLSEIEALNTHKVCIHCCDWLALGSTLNLATTTTVISTSKPTGGAIDDYRGALLRSVSVQHLSWSGRFDSSSLTRICHLKCRLWKIIICKMFKISYIISVLVVVVSLIKADESKKELRYLQLSTLIIFLIFQGRT